KYGAAALGPRREPAPGRTRPRGHSSRGSLRAARRATRDSALGRSASRNSDSRRDAGSGFRRRASRDPRSDHSGAPFLRRGGGPSGGFPDGSAGSRAPEGRAGRVGAKREGLEVAAAPGLREHLDADEAVEAAAPQGRAEAVELEGALAGEDAAVDRLLAQIVALERRGVVELHAGEAGPC